MRKIKLSIFIILIMMLALPTMVQAGFQSKEDAKLLSRLPDMFFEGCRNMEADGGVLGLSENIQKTTYLGTTNNGIDAHMALNTEWGTIALLTDSAYGIGKDIAGTNSTKTSTGNKTGIYNLVDDILEFTATTYPNTKSEYNEKIRNSNGRYFNNYDVVTRTGDALECVKWLSTTETSKVGVGYPVYVRGKKGLFGYDYFYGNWSYSYTSRAVVVCGTGL